jgi:hypothetical protein
MLRDTTRLAPGCEIFLTDIPHRGSDGGEYSSVKPGIPIAQELEQVLVLFR